jgi:hypothetical protein
MPPTDQTVDNEYDFSAAAEGARDKVRNAIDTARQRTGEVVARGEQCVRERPGTSLLSAFALGLAVGALIAIASRPQPKATLMDTLGDSIGDSRDRLADMFGSVASNLRGPLKRTYSSVSDGASTIGDSVMRAVEKVCPSKNKSWW